MYRITILLEKWEKFVGPLIDPRKCWWMVELIIVISVSGILTAAFMMYAVTPTTIRYPYLPSPPLSPSSPFASMLYVRTAITRHSSLPSISISLSKLWIPQHSHHEPGNLSRTTMLIRQFQRLRESSVIYWRVFLHTCEALCWISFDGIRSSSRNFLSKSLRRL